jgi:NADH-quinone oxidoreductase subunit G
LQQTVEAAARALHINQALADALGLSAGETAALGQNGRTIELPIQIDARVPAGCVWLQGAQHAALGLECGFGPVTLGMLNG